MAMKVSIITVCFNSALTLEDTLKSIESQTYNDIEYIVVDGGSTDGTLDIINKYISIIDYFISEKDHGLYDAINKGISLAKGDIIGMLNSDDVFFDSTSVSTIVKNFDSNTDAVYADLVYVRRDNLALITRPFKSNLFSKKLVRFGFCVAHPTFYVRSELYKNNALYDLDYKIAGDFELIIRYLMNGMKTKYIPTYLVKMREGGLSSGSLLTRIKQNIEIVNACRKNGIYTNIFFVALKLPYKIYTLLLGLLHK